MIITEKKPFSSILKMMEGYRKVFIMGCADCATLCKTGGEAEVEDMRLKLEKHGKVVTGTVTPTTPCHVQKAKRELRIMRQEVEEAEVVLVLACGAGVQSVSEVLKQKRVLPGLNTLFLGNVVRYGWFEERCSMCGDCILDKTYGICPVTRCAKSLVNGPCGGSVGGKCEVFRDRDCAWAMIFERFEKAGRLDLLEKYQRMKDFEISIKPGTVDIREETQDERADRLAQFKAQKIKIRKKFERELKKSGGTSILQRNEPVSSLHEKLQKGEFVITCEIVPPKGVNVERTLKEAFSIKEYVTAFSINENPGSIMRVASLSMSALFVKEGLEPILHLTTRERNRLALQSELLGAYVMGIRNILGMTGDHQSVGDHREAKPVYDLDSVQLIRLARELTTGRDYNGNPLDGAPHFLIGGVVNPIPISRKMQILMLKKKIKAGASFFITQAIFDVKALREFLEEMEKQGIKTKIIAGIIPLKSPKMAMYMNEHIPGIYVPESLIHRIDAAEDKKKEAIKIARETIKECRKLVDGIHLMPIGWYDLVPHLL